MVEQDSLPPPGSIARLLACRWRWCCHAQLIDGKLQWGTLGLVKFSQLLRRQNPELCDHALARFDAWYAIRRGLTHLPADYRYREHDPRAERVCLRAGVRNPWPAGESEAWPTTRTWITADTDLYHQLLAAGVPMHRHYPAPHHLHDYSSPHPSWPGGRPAPPNP